MVCLNPIRRCLVLVWECAQGVWIALAGISTLQACVLAIATTLRFNWDSLAEIARIRAVVEQEGQLPLLGEGHHGIVEDK